MSAARVVITAADADYRLLVRLALAEDARFTVVGDVESPRDLVTGVRTARADVAVIDCDGDEAFDVLARLRVAVPNCRVVLVSGYGEDDLRFATRALGAVGYLRKDVAASRLADELADLIAVVGLVQEILLDADLRNASVARRFVDTALKGWGLSGQAEVVKLLVSELVTNAIVHAQTEVDVAVRLTAGAARVEVSDRSEVAPTARRASTDDESGRGLAFVESLAQAWGVRPRPGGGKTVWFEVERPGVAAAS